MWTNGWETANDMLMPKIKRSNRFIKDVASRLRAVRITSGYDTTDAFADRLGVKGQTYRRYERAEVLPPHELLVQISELTGYSLDWLLAGKAPTERKNPVTNGREDGEDPVTA